MINSTFLIQIANFWICYFFFHRFFLKPAVKLVHKKVVFEETVVKGLKEKEGMLAHLQHDKKNNLETFRSYIKKNYPLPVPLFDSVPKIDLVTIESEEKAAFARVTCDLFIKKACDAF